MIFKTTNNVRLTIISHVPSEPHGSQVAMECVKLTLPSHGGQTAGCIPKWFTRKQMVTHHSTNQAQCRVTLLIKISVSPQSQTTTVTNVDMVLLIYIHEYATNASIIYIHEYATNASYS